MMSEALIVVLGCVGFGYAVRCNPLIRGMAASGWPIMRCPACLAFWASWVMGFFPFGGLWVYWCLPFASYAVGLLVYHRMASACGLDRDATLGD